MAENLKARKSIKHDGKFYSPGQIIKDVEQKHAQRLINLGAAVFVSGAMQEAEVIDDDLGNAGAGNNENNSDANDKNGEIDDGLGGIPGIDDLSDEQVTELIDDHFKLDLLKDEAAAIGMKFAGNISKTNLIQQILEEEQEQHFLDQIPE